MNLAAMDLNLFLVLHAVMEEGSATRAAKRLNLTQSAVSNSLARLRLLFKDPLFVRSGRGLLPTPRTQELARHLRLAMTEMQTAIGPVESFAAEETVRRFSLSCADNLQICEVPRLVDAMSQKMPRASLRVVSADYLLAKGGLANADVDVALVSSAAAKGLRFQPLFREEAIATVRRDHPITRKKMTHEEFNTSWHVDVIVTLGESGNSRNWFEKHLSKHGLSRQVAASVPSFSTAGMVVVESDLVACVPRRVAQTLARHLPLRILELPVQGFYLEVGLAWHQKTETDAGARHFRSLIVDTLQDGRARSNVSLRVRAR